MNTHRRMRRRTRLLTFAAVAAAFMTAGVSSAFATVVACGQVIVADTKVSNDLVDCPGDGLVIGAPGIRLNLDGHTIDGDAVIDTADDGIDNSRGFADVTIRNGVVQQFSQG